VLIDAHAPYVGTPHTHGPGGHRHEHGEHEHTH
jgi:hypothetical protein